MLAISGAWLTIPGLEHVVDEEVVEADLGLGDGAGGAVELGHHHRQTLRLLVISLDKGELLIYLRSH